MNLAVKLWSEVPSNPSGIPGSWPAEVRENVDIALGPEWQIWTKDYYETYRQIHQAEYLAWKALQPDPEQG